MGQHLTTWKERNYKQIKIVVAGFIIFTVGTIIIYSYQDLQKDAKEENNKRETQVIVTKPEIKEKKDIITEKGWMVDIKGEVTTTGTYAVSDEMRVTDVIQLAGGLTKNADTSILNLSQKIRDQMVIIIYSKDQVKNMAETIETEKRMLLQCREKALINNDACIKDKENQAVTGKVNINTATKEDFLKLSGIGESKADAIIDYRNKKRFEKIEEIMEVSGIGESVFEAIKEYIIIE